VYEYDAGPIYHDAYVQVEAFRVQHGSWPAFGLRFTTADRTIVVSGDTRPFDGLAAHYRNCDLLVHEVYSVAGFQRRPPEWQRYHASAHTSTTELAALANESRPGLIVLVHQLFWGTSEEELVAEISERYDGPVVSGHDLDLY
jgi:ribonuclease BN (tRNA processing enzyme)